VLGHCLMRCIDAQADSALRSQRRPNGESGVPE